MTSRRRKRVLYWHMARAYWWKLNTLPRGKP